MRLGGQGEPRDLNSDLRPQQFIPEATLVQDHGQRHLTRLSPAPAHLVSGKTTGATRGKMLFK